MAIILYVYSTTSIRAAKRNAALHREADGGQVDMRRESLRRHGLLDKVEGTRDVDLFRNAKKEDAQKKPDQEREGETGGRTEVEKKLESLKGRKIERE